MTNFAQTRKPSGIWAAIQIPVFILLGVSGLIDHPAYPQFNECAWILSDHGHHAAIQGYPDPELPLERKAELEAIVSRYGVPSLKSTKLSTAISQAFETINTSPGTKLEHSDKMAKFAVELEPFYKRLPKDTRKTVDTYLSLAVMRLEKFDESEYQETDASTFILNNPNPPNIIDFSQYREWTEGYVDSKPPYSTAPAGGLLTQRDIRDMESHNMWPIYLRPHDMNHAFYALSHPRATAMIFEAARSKDSLRYVMMSAMYEGVDTVQFYQETTLARYMKKTRKLDLEDAMIHLGHCTHDELVLIANESNTLSAFQSLVQYEESFVPRKTTIYPSTTRQGISLQSDVEHMLAEWRAYASNPAVQPYLKYARNLELNARISPDSIHKGGEASKPDQEIIDDDANIQGP